MADTSKQCTLTNNSNKDVVVILAVPPGESGSADAVQATGGGLEILKTTGGGTVINKGSSGTVTLDHTYTSGTGGNKYVQQYDLAVSDKDWLYPLALFSADQKSDGYPPQTITKDSGTAMNAAVAFYQTVTAYPDSELTKNFMAALDAAKQGAKTKADGSAGSAAAAAGAIETVIKAFFSGTKEYGGVTLPHLLAVDAYYNQFPAIWAQYKDSLTYYLYGSDGKTTGFTGTLTLTKSGSIDITRPGGGYTCTFAPAVTPSDTSKTDVDNQKAVTLMYDQGVFVNDTKSIKPEIALKGSFMLQRKFTNKPADTNVLSVLAGKAAGMYCIGFDQPQTGKAVESTAKLTLTSTDDDKFWDSLFHPKSQVEVLKEVAVIMSFIAAIPLLAGAVYVVYKFVKALDDFITPSDWDTLNDGVNEDISSESILRFQKYCEEDGEWKDVDWEKIAKEDALFENKLAKGKLLEGLQKQSDSIDAIMAFFDKIPTRAYADLLTARDGISTSISNLNSATDANIAAVVKSEVTDFSTRQTSLGGLYKNVQAKISSEAATSVSENLSLSAKTLEEITNETRNENEEEYEVDPYVRDVLVPELATL